MASSKNTSVVSFSLITILSVMLFFTFYSCKKTEKPESEQEQTTEITETPVEETVKYIPVLRWSCFTKDGIEEIESPYDVPATIFRPWTETLRVAGAAKISNNSYFLINRLGLLLLPDSLEKQPELITDAMYFTDTTVSNLVSVENNPVFHVYRNSFFNSKASESPLPFLIQYRTENKIFFPLLRVTDLELNPTAETVHLMYDGSSWTAAFKTSTKEKIDFNYLQFFSYEPLISLTSVPKPEQIQKQELSIDLFKQIVCNYEFEKAPERVKKLLVQIPQKFSLDLNYSNEKSGTPVNYVRQGAAENALLFKGTVKDFGTCVISLFEDGTTYFSGALPNTYILRNGKPVVFRLPKLPKGFIYNDFVISGNILYAAWEEEFFYQTARAGFISVDLKKLLYEALAVADAKKAETEAKD
ncbi:MAG: hypothetical protein J5631_03280 [Spirochaetaceae bacterium]|nr:hypothetical protein [Spirochaetaceae bacterium]MBR4823944.1 hypothetical protein [Spirochaetaceae bacterium]